MLLGTLVIITFATVDHIFAQGSPRDCAPLEPLDDAAFLRSHYPSADALSEGLAPENPREQLIALLTVLPQEADAIEFLDRLAPLAAGRDPDVAPAAVRAAVKIAEACDLSSLELMELQVPEGTRRAWQEVIDAEPRGDIRAGAEFVLSRLALVESTSAQASEAESAQTEE